MRDFRFRVWDILNKKMLAWGDIFDLPAWEIFPGTPEQRCFDVMQYIGLKDEKGEKIYEGDILKITRDDGECFHAEVCYFDWRGYPAFDLRKGFQYSDSNDLSYIHYAESEYIMEVVGNIHENRGLLNEEVNS